MKNSSNIMTLLNLRNSEINIEIDDLNNKLKKLSFLKIISDISVNEYISIDNNEIIADHIADDIIMNTFQSIIMK
jgi:hypothetical protein